MNRLPIAVLSALGMLVALPLPVLAHDPPAGENPLVLLLVHRVLELIPGWLFVIAFPALLLGFGLLFVWARGRIELVDQSE